ncbi:hypothetical protein C3Y94_026180 [Rhizobium ruizarguesonis]|uniref:hypothetical protein n=1 Tax=Rhizobium ruizarguesonis TaxID=2081791 RepID=UPI0016396F56|nr:hypothetical protein [Rhizobium ruizarguesonis]MBC2806644.1 hypothetical protein [Rhizobium ruizarguesonis]
MKLNLKKDLTPIRAAAASKVDAEAEATRGLYVTLGAGQAMTYIEKERQAQMVTEDPNINPALVPMVAIDAERYGDSLLDAAAVILTMAQYWRVIGPVIEDRRMSAKDRIATATTPAEIEAAAVVDWSITP